MERRKDRKPGEREREKSKCEKRGRQGAFQKAIKQFGKRKERERYKEQLRGGRR